MTQIHAPTRRHPLLDTLTDVVADVTAFLLSPSFRIGVLVALAILAVIATWAAAVVTYGAVALTLPALALVPVMFLVLVIISRG